MSLADTTVHRRLLTTGRRGTGGWDAHVVEVPDIRYVATPAGSIAWQTTGPADAPPLLFVPPLAQHIEMMWEKAAFWRPITRLTSRVRMVQFDKLGTGLSDPAEQPHDLDARVEQVVAVMDAAGLERTALLGLSEGGIAAAAVAARHPDRVSALVLGNTLAGTADLEGVAAFGPLAEPAAVVAFWKRFVDGWGTADTLTLTDFAPSLTADESMRRWMPSYERAAASPLLIGRWVRGALALDVTAELDAIRAPTLVIHLRGDRVVPIAHGRYLASRIAGAELVELDGDDHFLWVSAGVDDAIDAIHGFLDAQGLALPPGEVGGGDGAIRRRWDPYATLTPSERRCARLAQRGLTNAAIAETLGLSVRTVENHLSRSFTKLGVTSRVELALLPEP
jgi:pimeloyl-ACP methyl ester carboxylesterase/DNA-binding CsgD family transcriptional regulator